MHWRMLTDAELETVKGIPGSPVKIWRMRRDLRLFQARKFGSTNVNPEPLADKYNAAIAAGRTEQEATLDAERHLAKLLALEEGHSEEEAKLIAEAHVTKLLAMKAERDVKAAQAMATAPPRRQVKAKAKKIPRRNPATRVATERRAKHKDSRGAKKEIGPRSCGSR